MLKVILFYVFIILDVKSKSGTSFFFCNDDKFVIKIIKKSEFEDFLKNI